MIYSIGGTKYDGETTLKEMFEDQKKKRGFEDLALLTKPLILEIKEDPSAEDILNGIWKQI